MVQELLAEMCIGDPTERIRLGIVLEEALRNAILHGNLELTAKELSSLPSVDAAALIDRRRSNRPYRDRQVTVNTHISNFGTRFVIRDEGQGFDPSQTIGCGAETFEVGLSRGLTLMHRLMDEVAFNEAGNEVTMIRRSRPLASQPV
jgi:anti-sigma regulatory factor (Ser/Thr protein kinase)